MSTHEAFPSSTGLTDSRLAALCAQATERAFLQYQDRFHAITARARERFLARDWSAVFVDAAERLRLYGKVMDDLTDEIANLTGDRLKERSLWSAIKAVYSSLIARSPAWEIAESF